MRCSGAPKEGSQGALAPPKKRKKEINVATTEVIQELCKKKNWILFSI